MNQLKKHKEQFDPKRVKWGEAYNDLRSDPRFNILMEMEQEIIKSLGIEVAAMIPSQTHDYSHEVAYRNGIISGIQTLQNYRDNSLGEYQRFEAMENKEVKDVLKKKHAQRSIY